ncbi:MAG: RNA polymerase sigma factor [Opitutaceae bacterium]
MPPPQNLDHTRWFTEEVHPHASSLRAYLRGAFPDVRDVDDMVQESFLRTWRARATRPIRSARGFLFQVARRVAIDLVRHQRVEPIAAVRDLAELSVFDDRPDAADAISAQEKIRLLADAIETLPARCREIVVLRKIECLPQKAVAARLGLAEKSVEAQLARGIARCEVYLRRHGVRGWYGDE